VSRLAVPVIVSLAAFAAGGAADSSLPPDLSGTWAMIQFMPEVANLPFVGEVTITPAVAVLVHVEQDGTLLTMRDTYCRTDVRSSRPILLSEVPEIVMTSLDPPPRTARLEATDDGWRLLQDQQIEVRGAILENPEADELPMHVFDPRIVDMDGDGHPGFTIPVSLFGIISGDTYVVQRLIFRIDGLVLDEDRIEGRIDWSSEQPVIGATDGLLMSDFEHWHDPDPAKHRFIMIRLADDAGCAEAIAILETFVEDE
jgi:hypothetical protein